MEFESNGLSREEMRKKRRKKERTQAMILLAVVLLVICLIIGVVVFVLVRIFSGDKEKPDSQAVDAVATESVIDVAEDEVLDVEDTVTDSTEENEEESQEISGEETSQTEEEDTEVTDNAISEMDEAVESGDEEPEDDIADLLNDEPSQELEAAVTERISSMTLEQKVAELFFVTPAQLMGIQSDVTVIGSDFGEKMVAYPVGGIVLDTSNMVSEEEFATLVSNLGVYASKDMFIGIENQGGEEAPFVTAGLTENIISSPQEIGESLGVSGAYSAGISLGSELHQYGINVNFAPNVDVSLKEGSVAQQDGFGTDMATTAELGKNVVKGLTDQGIHAAVQHFPSYGDVTHDGDSGQVISQRTKEDLAKEYQPYLEAIDAGAEFVMVSHVSLPKVRGDRRPASLSKEIITDIIRTEWEYDGIVITDFMNRSCMYQEYTYAEAAVGAIEAGADMILAPKNFQKSYQGILDAVKGGKLTEERIDESLRRIYRVKLNE